MIDTSKMLVPDIEIIQKAFPSYLLATAFEMINNSGKRHIPAEWMEILNIASVAPFNGLPTNRVKTLATEMDMVARGVTADCGATHSSEFALGAAMAIMHLVKDGKVLDTKIQGVLVGTRFVEEAFNFEDVADMKLAKKCAGMVRNSLNRQGLYL